MSNRKRHWSLDEEGFPSRGKAALTGAATGALFSPLVLMGDLSKRRRALGLAMVPAAGAAGALGVNELLRLAVKKGRKRLEEQRALKKQAWEGSGDPPHTARQAESGGHSFIAKRVPMEGSFLRERIREGAKKSLKKTARDRMASAKIQCRKCKWSWRADESSKTDLLNCHKCGGTKTGAMVKTAKHTAGIPPTKSHPYEGKADIEKLWKVVEGRKPKWMKPEDAPKFPRMRRTGFGPKRLEGADPSFPVLIMEDGHLIDGRHRVAKLQEQGKKIPYIRVTDEDIDKVRIEKQAYEGGTGSGGGFAGWVQSNSLGGPSSMSFVDPVASKALRKPQRKAAEMKRKVP